MTRAPLKTGIRLTHVLEVRVRYPENYNTLLVEQEDVGDDRRPAETVRARDGRWRAPGILEKLKRSAPGGIDAELSN